MFLSIFGVSTFLIIIHCICRGNNSDNTNKPNFEINNSLTEDSNENSKYLIYNII